MKLTVVTLSALLVLFYWRNSVGEEQTVTFIVENMTCALCPITVRTAMQQVEGVKTVVVDLQARTATVVFDTSVATPERIAKASGHAGYPARQNM